MQPRLLDRDHYYVALGSGKLSADPFLRFLGGVAGQIRVAVFERDNGTGFVARELPDTEIEEHEQAVESAAEALRDWRKNIQSGAAAQGVPQPPTAPP